MPSKDKIEAKPAEYRNLRDGKTYTLAVKDRDVVNHARTHQAASSDSFWDGTEAEFRAQFDKL